MNLKDQSVAAGLKEQSVAADVSAISGVAANSLTVSSLIDGYMAAYAGRDPSRSQRLLWWQLRLGALPVAAVTDDDVFHALEELARRPARVYSGRDADGAEIFRPRGRLLSPATVNRYQHALAAVFTWAKKKRLVPRGYEHPCRQLDRQPENNDRVRFLSIAERDRLLASCRAASWPKLYCLVLMAITTGARRGELLWLRGRDVDLDQAVATIARTKNGDRRVLPLTPAVRDELIRRLPRSPDALIFGSARRPDVPYHLNIAWQGALTAAKIRDFRFHDLRHCCASYLAQNGATLLEIADVLGHRQLSVTRRYAHLTTQHKAGLVERVLGGIR